ncbi:MAG: hypothetical protein K8U57_35105 [Planctomycetes bacterium]|nr:hypothetical protein [Planctomycetota bacterium]
MLRRPSDSSDIPIEEGCSSTAFVSGVTGFAPVWDNPADRGFGTKPVTPDTAVP